MEEDFLESNMLAYIEKDIAQHFDFDTIIKHFTSMKELRAQFRFLLLHRNGTLCSTFGFLLYERVHYI